MKLSAGFLALFLVGCATSPPSRIVMDVTVFHKLQLDSAPSFALIPLDEQETSLEFESYAGHVRRALANEGW